MSELIFDDRPLEEALHGILAAHDKPKIDLITISGTIHRNERYVDVRQALDHVNLPVTMIDAPLALESIDRVLPEHSFDHLLVIGGGRLIDFSKILCQQRDASLSVMLVNLSNDGFASGCSALPETVGGDFVTVASRQPERVYAVRALLERMPDTFIVSGLGEVVSKLHVMDELQLEYDRIQIERIFCSPLDALYNLLFREFAQNHQWDWEFLRRLTQVLYEFSVLMRDGSELCSRSEHEFEKVCAMHRVDARHGMLVLLGAMVSMKLRTVHPELFEVKEPMFTYETLLKVIKKFRMGRVMHETVQTVLSHFSKVEFTEDLKKLSGMRPQRIGLWNFVDASTIDWRALLEGIASELHPMERVDGKHHDQNFVEVLED